MGIVSDQEWTRLFCSLSVCTRTAGQHWKALTPDTRAALLLWSHSFCWQISSSRSSHAREISSPWYLPVTLQFLPARTIVPMVLLAEQLVLDFLNLFQTRSKGLAPRASMNDLSKPSRSYLTQRVISTTCVAGCRRGCLLPLQGPDDASFVPLLQ